MIALLWQDGTTLDELRVPTRDPDSTFAGLLPRLQQWWDDQRFDALGIASFGPVTLDQDAEDHGCIRTTPKPGWTRTAVLPRLRAHFACPIAIETDVNAAALAEYRWGHGQGADSLVYLTLGTRVGGGVLIGGQPVHGRLHPELGHLLLRRAPGDSFEGKCPFHRDCVEGLLSGPALHARFGVDAATVPAGDPRWDVVAHDLAQLPHGPHSQPGSQPDPDRRRGRDGCPVADRTRARAGSSGLLAVFTRRSTWVPSRR